MLTGMRELRIVVAIVREAAETHRPPGMLWSVIMEAFGRQMSSFFVYPVFEFKALIS